MYSMATTIVIVDDEPAFRTVVRALLEAGGFEVVGEAADVRGALAAGRSARPDVVLLDVRLPDGSGVDAARVMRGWVDPPLVVLTSTADYSHAVVGCGATGFVPKNALSAAAVHSLIDATS